MSGRVPSVSMAYGFLARIAAGVAELMDEHVDPPLPVVHRLAGVVLLLGVIGVEKAAHRRMSSAVDVKQLAVFAHAAAAPDPDVGVGAKEAGRHLDRGGEDVGLGVGIHTGPR